MDPWTLLQTSVHVARSVQRTEQLLRGGVVADALVEFGEVMQTSARDHLREAHSSPTPRRRVEDAAADMQTAYHAYNRALNHGAVTWLRPSLAGMSRRLFGQYRRTLGQVAGSAAVVAVLRADLGEPVDTVREWLDRVARPVALERKAGQVRAAHGSAIDTQVRWSGTGDAAIRRHLVEYFTLERLLLPAERIRPLPEAWTLTADGQVRLRSLQELRGQKPLSLPLEGLSPEERDFYVSRPDLHYSLGDINLIFARDEPGPHDIVLMVPPERVVPVYDESASR